MCRGREGKRLDREGIIGRRGTRPCCLSGEEAQDRVVYRSKRRKTVLFIGRRGTRPCCLSGEEAQDRVVYRAKRRKTVLFGDEWSKTSTPHFQSKNSIYHTFTSIIPSNAHIHIELIIELMN